MNYENYPAYVADIDWDGGWISLKTLLPPENVPVVLADREHHWALDAAGCIKQIGMLTNAGNGFYWTVTGYHAQVMKAATHWMPLPRDPG